MARSTTFSVLALFLCFVVFASAKIEGETIIVTEFPHYQTFDTFDICSTSGLCYEKACPNLKGGWKNVAFHGSYGYPSGITVRHWWVTSNMTSSNRGVVADPANTYRTCDGRNTGPCGDHTTGVGHYLYAESSACFGTTYQIDSPLVEYSSNGTSFGFWYYMFGSDLQPGNGLPKGKLSLLISTDNATSFTNIVTFTGQQQQNASDPWRYFETPVDKYLPYIPNVNKTVPVIFRFEATSGGKVDQGAFWKSDIAIDDVLIRQSVELNYTVPFVDPPVINTTASVLPSPPSGIVSGDGDGLSTGAIVGIAVGIAGGLCCLCILLVLLVLAVLLLVSPRKKAGGGGGGDL